ncbi:MAG TPA: anaerobic ribonucleoside-triphosphate reductase activating protein [Candidatus Bathyarchaeia archaeon]|nr:anaerobic ribonucleoside-triphosphate reductase activating protein [Candidatus Bathyarchaeia archaeon]
MIIGGLQKTTLIDFPSRVACTVFTVGCNFRCPYCHNRDLVSWDLFKKSKIKPIKEKDFFEFLEKRKKILDGVCITGGEPTLQPDLCGFCQKIKAMGLEVKLDTNGSNPEVLKQLIDKKLIDFVAMDIKTAFGDYAKTVFKSKNKNSALIYKIKKSIKIILESGLEYEFRTTIVPKIHTRKKLVGLVKQLKSLDTEFKWTLQQFRPQNCLDPDFLKVQPFNERELENILTGIKKVLRQTKIKGIN